MAELLTELIACARGLLAAANSAHRQAAQQDAAEAAAAARGAIAPAFASRPARPPSARVGAAQLDGKAAAASAAEEAAAAATPGSPPPGAGAPASTGAAEAQREAREAALGAAYAQGVSRAYDALFRFGRQVVLASEVPGRPDSPEGAGRSGHAQALERAEGGAGEPPAAQPSARQEGHLGAATDSGGREPAPAEAVPARRLLHGLLRWLLLSASVGQATVELGEATGPLDAPCAAELWRRVEAHLATCAAEGRRTPMAAADVGVCADAFAALADRKVRHALEAVRQPLSGRSVVSVVGVARPVS